MLSVTGAPGKTGLAIIERCAERNVAVRALTHREERGDLLRRAGAADVRVADLGDRAALERGLDGSSVVYHICPNMRPDEVEIGERVIDACLRTGVERLVFHSVLHPQIEAMPHHWRKLRVEERLIESGLDFTILQPAAYVQNLKAQWRSILDDGVYEVPYAASTRLGMVDLRDVAEVATTVASETGHHAAVYELCGPEVLDQLEVAGVLAAEIDRPVQVDVIDRNDWARRARAAGLGEYAISSLIAMFAHYERYGFSGNPRILESLLGRPPARCAEVLRRWRAEEI